MVSVAHILSPSEARSRILNAAQAAEFWGVSLPSWRRMYRTQQVPAPLPIGVRKLGWRVGDLIDALEARSSVAGG